MANTGSDGRGLTGAKGSIRNIQEDELLQPRNDKGNGGNVLERQIKCRYLWFIAMKYRFPIPSILECFSVNNTILLFVPEDIIFHVTLYVNVLVRQLWGCPLFSCLSVLNRWFICRDVFSCFIYLRHSIKSLNIPASASQKHFQKR